MSDKSAADAAAYRRLLADSEPIPLDLSRGHELHLAQWPEVNGGVTVSRFLAICHCNWSQRFATYDRERAVAEHAEHVRVTENGGSDGRRRRRRSGLASTTTPTSRTTGTRRACPRASTPRSWIS